MKKGVYFLADTVMVNQTYTNYTANYTYKPHKITFFIIQHQMQSIRRMIQSHGMLVCHAAALCKNGSAYRGPVWGGDSWDSMHTVLDGVIIQFNYQASTVV